MRANRRDSDYDREAEAIQRQWEKCPRAAAMEARLFEALFKHRTHHLEVALVGLGARLDKGYEIGDLEEQFYERLISAVPA